MKLFYVRLYLPTPDGDLADETTCLTVEALTDEHAQDLVVERYPTAVIVDVCEHVDEEDDDDLEEADL